MSDPYCLAMVLCDAVHKDSATNKFTILGTFSTVGSPEFPTVVQLSVYFAITDLGGEYELNFRIVDSQFLFDAEEEPIFEATVPIESENPLAVFEGVIGLNGAVLPKPGVYHCELLIQGEVLMSRRLIALGPDQISGGE